MAIPAMMYIKTSSIGVGSCSVLHLPQGFIALHTGMLPILDVVHVEAGAVGEAAAAVQVRHLQVVTL